MNNLDGFLILGIFLCLGMSCTGIHLKDSFSTNRHDVRIECIKKTGNPDCEREKK